MDSGTTTYIGLLYPIQLSHFSLLVNFCRCPYLVVQPNKASEFKYITMLHSWKYFQNHYQNLLKRNYLNIFSEKSMLLPALMAQPTPEADMSTTQKFCPETSRCGTSCLAARGKRRELNPLILYFMSLIGVHSYTHVELYGL